ncbi:hypothetical protein [Leptodesmis sp.]|uniref:hypothetical protein n=1 Tax=Leptodesmis sp. TaxID=3100501 RepID=UPI00405347D1
MLILTLSVPKSLATLVKLQFVGWLLLLPVVGCVRPAISESGASPAIETIAIQDVPSQEKDAIVTLKGTVGDHAPLLGGTVYRLQDSTGKIWVLTTGQAPAKGQEIIVTGTLRYKSIPIAGQEQGSLYIEQ